MLCRFLKLYKAFLTRFVYLDFFFFLLIHCGLNFSTLLKRCRLLCLHVFLLVMQTSSSLIEGRWQLMFTTRPGTASPIQV